MNLKRFITFVISSIALLTLFFGSSIAATQNDNFSPNQVKSIQKIIHNYLVKNPKVLLEASDALRKQMQEKQESKAMQAIQKNKQALFNDPQSPIAGNPDGDIVLVEFFDYQCPHCKEMNTAIKSLIANNKNLRVVFKEWPIFGGSSLEAAKATIAANKQGKYFELHEALLEAGNPLTSDKIFQSAKQAGINVATLKKDMDSKDVMQQIKSNFKLARALSLVGTPAFILSNHSEDTFRFVPGATTEQKLQQLINQLIA